jgi:lycopene cyclase domain-containing protein
VVYSSTVLAGGSAALGGVPDISVFGPYTYLVTEVVFGSFAAILLWRTNAVRRATTTIAVLYPIAYTWDWYTLEVGVFAIPLRTGAELLGIPIEEHLFIVVVPSLVIGIHEFLHGRPGKPSDEAPPTERDYAIEGSAKRESSDRLSDR